MNILSPEFLGLCAVSGIICWTFSHWSKRYTVLLCNALFFWLLQPSPMHLAYLAGLILLIWLGGKRLQGHPEEKFWCGVLFAIPAVGLIIFKYSHLLNGVGLLMPLGLSFYTFKAIAYMAEIAKGKMESRSLVDTIDYITFFPVFQAGPINRPAEFFEELEKPLVFDYRDQKNGFIQAALGMFQKLVIADQLSHLTSVFLDTPGLNGFYTLAGMVLYAFQLYVDFDAYSNVALGVSRMLGFHLKRNFHTPYLAVSIKDFWNRWHISLSSWLQDYIYIPLGGSRKGYVRKYLNVLIVFLVSGIWHGSTLTFVVWGLGHGLVNITEDLIRRAVGKQKWIRFLAPLGIVLNFMIVTALWVPFRAASLGEAVSLFANLKTIVIPESLAEISTAVGITMNEVYWMGILLAMVVLSDLLRRFTDAVELLSRQFILFRWAFYIVLILIAIVFGVYGPGYQAENFIYVTF